MIVGDYLLLTDVGFGLLCTFMAGLLGVVVWQGIELFKAWRKYHQQKKSKRE